MIDNPHRLASGDRDLLARWVGHLHAALDDADIALENVRRVLDLDQEVSRGRTEAPDQPTDEDPR